MADDPDITAIEQCAPTVLASAVVENAVSARRYNLEIERNGGSEPAGTPGEPEVATTPVAVPRGPTLLSTRGSKGTGEFLYRPPRVNPDLYQVTVSDEPTKTVAVHSALYDGPERSMWSIEKCPLSKAKVNEWIQFVRSKAGTLDATVSADEAAESDHLALQLLCTAEYNLDVAGLLLVASLSAGGEAIIFERELDRHARAAAAAGEVARLPIDDPFVNTRVVLQALRTVQGKSKADFGMLDLDEKDKLRFWQDWVAQTSDALNGKAPPVIQTLIQLMEQAVTASNLSAFAGGGGQASMAMTVTQTLQRLTDLVESATRWQAQVRDALSGSGLPPILDKLERIWSTGQGLRVQLPELAVVSTIVRKARKWQRRATDLLRTDTLVDFADLAAVAQSAAELPIRLPLLEAVNEKIARCRNLAARIVSVFSFKSSVRRANARPTAAKPSLDRLQAFLFEVNAEQVKFGEGVQLQQLEKQVLAWCAEVDNAIESRGDLRMLTTLRARGEEFPIELPVYLAKVDAEIEKAEAWMRKVRDLVPRSTTKTRRKGEVERVSLDTLTGLLSDARATAADEDDVAHVADVVDSASDWIARAKEAIASGDEQTIKDLQALLREADNIPVLMAEHQLLSVEVESRLWGTRVRKALESKPKLELLRELAKELVEIRKALPKDQRNLLSKLKEEGMIRKAIADGEAWQLRTRRCFAKRLSEARVLEYIKEADAIALNTAGNVTKLQELLQQAAAWEARARELLGDAAAVILDAHEEVDDDDNDDEPKPRRRGRGRAPRKASQEDDEDASDSGGDQSSDGEQDPETPAGKRKAKHATPEAAEPRSKQRRVATGDEDAEAGEDVDDATAAAAAAAGDGDDGAPAAEEDTTAAASEDVDMEPMMAESKSERAPTPAPVAATVHVPLEVLEQLLKESQELKIIPRKEVHIRRLVGRVHSWIEEATDAVSAPAGAPGAKILTASELSDHIALGLTFPVELTAHIERCRCSLDACQQWAARLVDTFDPAKQCCQRMSECLAVGVDDNASGAVTRGRGADEDAPVVTVVHPEALEAEKIRISGLCVALERLATEVRLLHVTSDSEEQLLRFLRVLKWQALCFDICKMARFADRKAWPWVISHVPQLEPDENDTHNKPEERLLFAVAVGEELVDGGVFDAFRPDVQHTLRLIQQVAAECHKLEERSMSASAGGEKMQLTAAEELLATAGDLANVSAGLLRLKGDVDAANEWNRQATSALRARRKWSVTEMTNMLNAGEALRVQASTVPLLRAELKNAKKWLAAARKMSGHSGANVSEMRALLQQAEELKVDLGDVYNNVRNAVQVYCLCKQARTVAGMLQCERCQDMYHSQCLGLEDTVVTRFLCLRCGALEVYSSVLRDFAGELESVGAASGRHDDGVAHPPSSRASVGIPVPIAHWVSAHQQLLSSACNGDPLAVDMSMVAVASEQLSRLECHAHAVARACAAILSTLKWVHAVHRMCRHVPHVIELENLLEQTLMLRIHDPHVTPMLTSLLARGSDWVAKARKAVEQVVKGPVVVPRLTNLLDKKAGIAIASTQQKKLEAMSSDGGKRYCICSGPNDGSFMVGCDKCDGWFHGKCVGVPEESDQSETEFICPACCRRQNQAYKYQAAMDARARQREASRARHQRAQQRVDNKNKARRNRLVSQLQQHRYEAMAALSLAAAATHQPAAGAAGGSAGGAAAPGQVGVRRRPTILAQSGQELQLSAGQVEVRYHTSDGSQPVLVMPTGSQPFLMLTPAQLASISAAQTARKSSGALKLTGPTGAVLTNRAPAPSVVSLTPTTTGASSPASAAVSATTDAVVGGAAAPVPDLEAVESIEEEEEQLLEDDNVDAAAGGGGDHDMGVGPADGAEAAEGLESTDADGDAGDAGVADDAAAADAGDADDAATADAGDADDAATADAGDADDATTADADDAAAADVGDVTAADAGDATAADGGEALDDAQPLAMSLEEEAEAVDESGGRLHDGDGHDDDGTGDGDIDMSRTISA